MATPLDLFPARVALVDIKTGRLTPEGYRAFAALFARVGGANAPSNDELAITDDDDSGLEEFKSEFGKALDGLSVQPRYESEPFTDPMHPLSQAHIPLNDPAPLVQEHVRFDEVLTELHGLREQVAVLQTQINDLQQGTTP